MGERAEDITLKDSLFTLEEFLYAKKFRTLQSANQNSSDKSESNKFLLEREKVKHPDF